MQLTNEAQEWWFSNNEIYRVMAHLLIVELWGPTGYTQISVQHTHPLKYQCGPFTFCFGESFLEVFPPKCFPFMDGCIHGCRIWILRDDYMTTCWGSQQWVTASPPLKPAALKTCDAVATGTSITGATGSCWSKTKRLHPSISWINYVSS